CNAQPLLPARALSQKHLKQPDYGWRLPRPESKACRLTGNPKPRGLCPSPEAIEAWRSGDPGACKDRSGRAPPAVGLPRALGLASGGRAGLTGGTARARRTRMLIVPPARRNM